MMEENDVNKPENQPLSDESVDLQTPDLLDEEYYYLEDEEENTSVPFYQKSKFLVPLLVLLVLGLAFLGYQSYPFASKVKGVWQSEDPAYPYTLTIQGKTIQMSQPLGGEKGTLIFEGELEGTGINEYNGKNLIAYARIDKNKLSQKEIDGLLKKNKDYRVTKDTANELVVTYGKGYFKKVYYETNGAKNLFHFTIERSPEEGKYLNIQNQQFAAKGLPFLAESK